MCVRVRVCVCVSTECVPEWVGVCGYFDVGVKHTQSTIMKSIPVEEGFGCGGGGGGESVSEDSVVVVDVVVVVWC